MNFRRWFSRLTFRQGRAQRIPFRVSEPLCRRYQRMALRSQIGTRLRSAEGIRASGSSHFNLPLHPISYEICRVIGWKVIIKKKKEATIERTSSIFSSRRPPRGITPSEENRETVSRSQPRDTGSHDVSYSSLLFSAATLSHASTHEQPQASIFLSLFLETLDFLSPPIGRPEDVAEARFSRRDTVPGVAATAHARR